MSALEQKRFYRFEDGKMFFGPAPNSTRSGDEAADPTPDARPSLNIVRQL